MGNCPLWAGVSVWFDEREGPNEQPPTMSFTFSSCRWNLARFPYGYERVEATEGVDLLTMERDVSPIKPPGVLNMPRQVDMVEKS